MNRKILQVSGFMLLSLLSMSTGWSQKELSKVIRYTAFTVTTRQNKVMIDWATDSKVVTNYFEIQKSEDGMNYKTIALVLGPDPKQPNCDCYSAIDNQKQKPSRQAYYRLKHIDTEGIIQYSESKLWAKS